MHLSTNTSITVKVSMSSITDVHIFIYVKRICENTNKYVSTYEHIFSKNEHFYEHNSEFNSKIGNNVIMSIFLKITQNVFEKRNETEKKKTLTQACACM